MHNCSELWSSSLRSCSIIHHHMIFKAFVIVDDSMFIYLFTNLYSTSSMKLLKGASNSSTVKKNSFKLITECVTKCP